MKKRSTVSRWRGRRGACGTARDVFDSYLQALSGVKSGIAARSRDSVVIYDDIRHIGRSYAYPKEELDALYAAVTGTRIDKVEFIHDVLVNTIRENYPNRFIITALCYDVVNVYLRAMDALKRPYLEMGDKYAGFIETEGRISIDSLLDVLYRIRDDAIAFLTSLTREARGDISRVVAYIHEHFRDPDFCASALAESFGMSLSNLSHQFRHRRNGPSRTTSTT